MEKQAYSVTLLSLLGTLPHLIVYTVYIIYISNSITMYLGIPSVITYESCPCHRASTLLRAGFFPMTPSQPQLALTVSCMRLFDRIQTASPGITFGAMETSLHGVSGLFSAESFPVLKNTLHSAMHNYRQLMMRVR